jgi:hypothetical protein
METIAVIGARMMGPGIGNSFGLRLPVLGPVANPDWWVWI